jgi:hypothetical protein
MVMREVGALSPEASVAAAPGSSPGASPRRGLIPLRAVFGQDEANHGTERYPFDDAGLVRVPLEAVACLTGIGGFTVPKTAGGVISAGTVIVNHADAAGCSYGGRKYFRNENGDVAVPAEAASELSAHGFAPVLREAKTMPKRSKPALGSRPAKG